MKLDPRRQVRNPVMFTVFVGSILTTGLGIHALVGGGAGIAGVHLRHLGLAVVHGAVRQLRRSDGRRARQSPGRRAAANPTRCDRQEAGRAASRMPRITPIAASQLAQRRRRARRSRRLDPGRRRSDRRRRLGRRKRHHRRKRAGHPRKRRRPQQRHRRHARALRLAGRAHHRQSRRDVSRPHDLRWSKAPSGRRRRTKSRSTSCWPR